jgi:cation diffusion facilitator family transporter
LQINVIVNIFLLAAKGVAAIWSNSLSLIASLVDSALDLLCTVIIWTTNKLVGWRLSKLKKKFPVGRRRLEPIGILVFSIIMVISFLQILKESVEKLLPSGEHKIAELPPAAIFAMVATIVVKGTIWFGCARVKTTQVQALAQDCKTDVYFNTLSLLFPLIGHKAGVWWLDPLGAAGLSLFIIYDWAGTCLENITRLTGEAASLNMERKVLFMAYRFAPLVEGFKSMKCYHAGDGVCVEIDILMLESTPLSRAHDVAETLQYCLEGLGEVDRAFVTIDCKSSRVVVLSRRLTYIIRHCSRAYWSCPIRWRMIFQKHIALALKIVYKSSALHCASEHMLHSILINIHFATSCSQYRLPNRHDLCTQSLIWPSSSCSQIDRTLPGP